jgi:hypothetical protein
MASCIRHPNNDGLFCNEKQYLRASALKKELKMKVIIESYLKVFSNESLERSVELAENINKNVVK